MVLLCRACVEVKYRCTDVLSFLTKNWHWCSIQILVAGSGDGYHVGCMIKNFNENRVWFDWLHMVSTHRAIRMTSGQCHMPLVTVVARLFVCLLIRCWQMQTFWNFSHVRQTFTFSILSFKNLLWSPIIFSRLQYVQVSSPPWRQYIVDLSGVTFSSRIDFVCAMSADVLQYVMQVCVADSWTLGGDIRGCQQL